MKEHRISVRLKTLDRFLVPVADPAFVPAGLVLVLLGVDFLTAVFLVAVVVAFCAFA